MNTSFPVQQSSPFLSNINDCTAKSSTPEIQFQESIISTYSYLYDQCISHWSPALNSESIAKFRDKIYFEKFILQTVVLAEDSNEAFSFPDIAIQSPVMNLCIDIIRSDIALLLLLRAENNLKIIKYYIDTQGVPLEYIMCFIKNPDDIRSIEQLSSTPQRPQIDFQTYCLSPETPIQVKKREFSLSSESHTDPVQEQAKKLRTQKASFPCGDYKTQVDTLYTFSADVYNQ